MSNLDFKTFDQLAPILIQKYQRYIPSAFSSDLSMLEKVNRVIEFLDALTTLNNDLLVEWEKLRDWVAEDGMTAEVNAKLDQMASDGTLDDIINVDLYENLSNRVDDLGVNLESYKITAQVDWTTALQNALNSGLPVVLPPREFEVSATIVVPSGAKIIGQKGSKIKAKNFTTNHKQYTFDSFQYFASPVFYIGNATDVYMENVIINADRVNQTTLANVPCLIVDTSTKVKIRDCEFMNNKMNHDSKESAMVTITDSTDVDVLNCRMNNIYHEGLMIRNSSFINIVGGIYEGQWNTVNEPDLYSSSVIGTQYGEKILIDGVKAHTTHGSVISLNSKNSKLVNSIFYGSKEYVGVTLGHRTTFATRKEADGCIIANNYVYDCYRSGINVQYANDVIVEGNRVTDCNEAYAVGDTANAYGGINVMWYSDKVTVANNVVDLCHYGVYVTAGYTDPDDVTYTTKGNHIITGNRCFTNSIAGIRVHNCSEFVQVIDNILYDNNIDDIASRGEIYYSCDLTGLTSNPYGNVIIARNQMRDSLVGIRFGHVSTWQQQVLPLFVKDNMITNCTTPISLGASGIQDDEIVFQSNLIDGKLRSQNRMPINGTSSANTINVRSSRFVQVNMSTATTINKIDHDHEVGTVIVLQFANGNTTLTDGTDLWLSSNFVATTNSTISLIWTGGVWLELSRVAQ